MNRTNGHNVKILGCTFRALIFYDETLDSDSQSLVEIKDIKSKQGLSYLDMVSKQELIALACEVERLLNKEVKQSW